MPGSKHKQNDEQHVAGSTAATSEYQKKFPVVGIGASAGGLTAFKTFFSAMTNDSGMAFVLIPHLDPTHQSMMVELLAAKTAMPVCEAKENMTIEPDHVYVIPPGVYMSIGEGKLHLSKPPEPRGAETAIDHFLLSLAKDQEAHAIAIILSGTGSHGSTGVRTVKAGGGMAIAQDPATAEYKDMPKNAIATGIIDYVLRPEKMPEMLIKYMAYIFLDGSLKPAPVSDNNKDNLGRILAIIQARTKYDFRCYRKSMLMRRVQRRMGLNHFDQMADYLEYLREDNDEIKQLFRDLLIGVTGFFRDPEAYQVLDQRVFPALIEHRDVDNPVRVWVPGCATGEEAYSITISLLEQFSTAKKRPGLRVFATDLDESALEYARKGIYPESITAAVPNKLLKKYFTKVDNYYQINKLVRDSVVFAPQNLVSDAPFSKLDMISCRNLLIYLETEVQKKVISLFHFAMNDNGYLFLGSSETIGQQTKLFETISKKWRIFHRIGPATKKRATFPVQSGERRHDLTNLKGKTFTHNDIDLTQLTERQLLDDYAPASVLINRQHEILYFHGPTGIFLELPTGKPTSNLIAMARKELRIKLRAVCNRAIYQNQQASDKTASVKYDNEWHYCTITVKPIHEPKQAEGLLLVTFSEHEKLSSSQTDNSEVEETGTVEESPLIRELEFELKAAREDLQNTVEEMETSNEEMKASNEEAMSMNEELQSANEELETSKEELQSLNEELNSVNSQLQDKVTELDKAHNDISNLLNSTDIAAIFLDIEMRIRQFTPATGKLLGLIPSDTGRTITTFSTNFTGKDLLSDAYEVLETLSPSEVEIWVENNITDGQATDPASTDDLNTPATGQLTPFAKDSARCFLRRIRPYRTDDNHIEGVVVTFMNITERKLGELENRENIRLQQMVENFPAALSM